MSEQKRISTEGRRKRPDSVAVFLLAFLILLIISLSGYAWYLNPGFGSSSSEEENDPLSKYYNETMITECMGVCSLREDLTEQDIHDIELLSKSEDEDVRWRAWHLHKDLTLQDDGKLDAILAVENREFRLLALISRIKYSCPDADAKALEKAVFMNPEDLDRLLILAVLNVYDIAVFRDLNLEKYIQPENTEEFDRIRHKITQIKDEDPDPPFDKEWKDLINEEGANNPENLILSVQDKLPGDIKKIQDSNDVAFLNSLLGNRKYKNFWGDAMYGLVKINTRESISFLIEKYKEIGDPYFGKTDCDQASKVFIALELGYLAQRNDEVYTFICDHAFNYGLCEEMVGNWGYQQKEMYNILYTTISHLIQAVGISGRDNAYDIIYLHTSRLFENNNNKYKYYRGSIVSAISYWDRFRRFGKKSFNAKPLVDLKLFEEWKKQRPDLMLWYKGKSDFPQFNKDIPWHTNNKTDEDRS